MADEKETSLAREIDESGRIRTPMSPATWTADEQRPEVQPGVVQTEPKAEPAPKSKPKAA